MCQLDERSIYDIISLMLISDNVTRNLLDIENEQRAQKVGSPLNFGQLAKPNDAPTASYNGRINNGSSDPVAIFIATFTRTDSIAAAPIVDFAWDFSLAKGYYQDQISAGYLSSVIGRDKQAIDQIKIVDAPYEFGNGYVKWMIYVPLYYWFYASENGTVVNLNVQAVSMVPGTLKLERTK